MKNILIINAREYYPFADGRLNSTLAERAVSHLSGKGSGVQTTTMRDDYDVATGVGKDRWVDVAMRLHPLRDAPEHTLCRSHPA